MSFIKNEIPKIINPLGKYWEQPDRSKIILHMKQAIMNQDTFDKLKNYSISTPSGVYEGKMWKSQNLQDGSWWLKWYVNDDNLKHCKVKCCKIVIK